MKSLSIGRRAWRSRAVSVIIITVLIALTGCSPQGGGAVEISNVEEMDAILEGTQKAGDVIVIDLRHPEDFEKGHYPGAFCFDLENNGKALLEFAQPFDKEKPFVLFCYRGLKSAQAGKILGEKGFQRVYSFAPGWNYYKAANGPAMEIEKGSCGCY